MQSSPCFIMWSLPCIASIRFSSRICYIHTTGLDAQFQFFLFCWKIIFLHSHSLYFSLMWLQSHFCMNSLDPTVTCMYKRIVISPQCAVYRSNNGCRRLWINFIVVERWESTLNLNFLLLFYRHYPLCIIDSMAIQL